MSCLFSPVPATRCREQQIVPTRAGEEVSTVLSPALVPLLISVILLTCVLVRQLRGPRRPW